MSHQTVLFADPIKFELAAQICNDLNALQAGQNADALVSPEELAAMMTRPPEPEMGDFALPCFRFAKALKKNPAQIAQSLKEGLEKQGHPLLSKAVQNQAFLNIFLDTGAFASMIVPRVVDQSWFAELKKHHDPKYKNVMIEYSQPNTHKEFHIGHGRNVSLGDSVSRLFEYTGHNVIPVNYIGDEGTHVAKCLWQVQEDFDNGVEAPGSDFTEWYGKRYVEANRRLAEATPEQKQSYMAKISEILAALESKQGSYYDLWTKSRNECLSDFKKVYDWLGAWFEHDFFESEVSEDSQSIVTEGIKSGLFTESEGAYGISLEDEGLGYFMARKSDGTSLYITKDLALAKKKFNEYSIDRSIYVVGCEQNFHFRQLFSVLEKMGFEQAKLCHHLSYAHVSLPEGKISSRKGNALTFMSLVNLIREEVDKHLEKYKGDWSDQEIEETGKKLSVAAIKYGMLSSDPQKEIVFDPASWTSFDGNSGPYLLYSYSRIQSILRECQKRGFKASLSHLNLLNSSWESELLNHMYDFNSQVFNACENYRPSVISNYLFNICKSFNRFYANISVLNAESDEHRSARMSLIEAYALVLKKGLELLGITPAERM